MVIWTDSGSATPGGAEDRKRSIAREQGQCPASYRLCGFRFVQYKKGCPSLRAVTSQFGPVSTRIDVRERVTPDAGPAGQSLSRPRLRKVWPYLRTTGPPDFSMFSNLIIARCRHRARASSTSQSHDKQNSVNVLMTITPVGYLISTPPPRGIDARRRFGFTFPRARSVPCGRPHTTSTRPRNHQGDSPAQT